MERHRRCSSKDSEDESFIESHDYFHNFGELTMKKELAVGTNT